MKRYIKSSSVNTELNEYAGHIAARLYLRLQKKLSNSSKFFKKYNDFPLVGFENNDDSITIILHLDEIGWSDVDLTVDFTFSTNDLTFDSDTDTKLIETEILNYFKL